jgi:hypothetical protein
MIGAARGLADSLVQVLLSLIVAIMVWTNGDGLVSMLHDALRRLGGPVGEHALDVAAGAIRGVAYGVIGTAGIQAVLLSVGLAVAGVPGGRDAWLGRFAARDQPDRRTAAHLIWGGAAWWLFTQDQQIWGVFMIVWGCSSVWSTISSNPGSSASASRCRCY